MEFRTGQKWALKNSTYIYIYIYIYISSFADEEAERSLAYNNTK